MTTDKTIEEMNEALAIFDGWCEVTDGKYSYETHVIHTTPATFEEHNAYQSSIKDK